MAKKRWEDIALERLANEYEATYLGAAQRAAGIESQPNFKIYGFSPNRGLDEDEQFLVAGPEWSIMQQVSQLKAMHDMLGQRLGFNFTFEEWFEDWKKGHPWAINRAGTPGLTTNYPLRGTGETPGWREDVEARPGYLEWSNPSKKNMPNYRVIEYFPSGTGESVLFEGSDMMIVQQILNWEWQKASGGMVAREAGETNSYSFKGQPRVNLWFSQSYRDKNPNYLTVRGKLSFRIIGKTERGDLVDQGKTPFQKLTAAEVQQIANRIISQFATPQPHEWFKGKNTISYRDKPRGIFGWAYVTSKTEGVSLYEKLTSVANIPFDRTKLRYTETDDADGAYPADPPNMKVMGKTMKGIRKRPYTPVYFNSSTLSVESLSHDIALTNNRIVTFDPNKFAEAANNAGT